MEGERLLLAAGGAVTALTAGALLALPAGPVEAQARSEGTVLMAPAPGARASQERYGYADAVIAGDFIFLSGLVAARRPGEADLLPAYERVYREIGAILERAGAGYGDIVDVTSFHTDIAAEIDTLAEVQRRFLGAPPPAWTAVQVVRLLPDSGETEIKITARRSAAAGH